MDEAFIKCLKTNIDIEQCQGCNISYEDSTYFTDGQVFEIMFKHGILVKSVSCKSCSGVARLCTTKLIPNYSGTPDDTLNYFKLQYFCNRTVSFSKKKKTSCNFRQSLFKWTYCHDSRLKLDEIFQLTCAVLTLAPPRNKFLKDAIGIASGSVVEWNLRLREVFIVAVAENSKQLGDEGHFVEIYECITGEVGNLDEPWSWALGGIDHSSRQTFLTHLEHFDSITIKDVILKKIHPGSTLVTNGLGKYLIKESKDTLENHEIKFIDASKSHLAEEIRQRWCEVKHSRTKSQDPSFRYTRKEYKIGHLAEYLFKSKYPKPRSRLHHFFEAAANLYSWSI